MRVWEFQDNKAIPSDLVREQDFILRVRRMQRQGNPCFVLNFVLNAIEALASSLGALEAVQAKLQEYARATKGAYYEMSNGDAFIVWEQSSGDPAISSKAIEAALSEFGGDKSKFLLTYHMPENYTLLRERTNHYVDAVRAAATVGGGFNRIEDQRGQLTAKTVDQIEHLLSEIDLRRYGRTQHYYRYNAGSWTTLGEEYFVSFEDLRRERFPKLEVVSSEHFFQAICGMLDQRLLAMLTTSYDIISGRPINLNVSIASIVGAVFAHFVRRIPPQHRPLIGFELHRGDLLQDFSLTLSAIEMLKHEGFRVILDSITPDMVPYIDLAAFPVDNIKINVSKDRALQLANPAIRIGLERLPADKLIFFRCDNEKALSIGKELGVTAFQGWLIDDLAGKKN